VASKLALIPSELLVEIAPSDRAGMGTIQTDKAFYTKYIQIPKKYLKIRFVKIVSDFVNPCCDNY
jgi:hypothetical protein